MDSSRQERAIKEGFRQAREITKKYAKTFYLAGRFLPRDQKSATFSIYAIGRISDEAVDGTHALSKEKLIARMKEAIAETYAKQGTSPDDPLLLSFQHAICKYQIPKEYFDELMNGISMDLEKSRYRDFEELYGYCYKVAGVVGLIMLKILGDTGLTAKKYAVDMGIAMQLTNILRDIAEDYERGRVYLPSDEMRHFGVTDEDIGAQRADSRFQELAKYQIRRARDYYASAREGIASIPGSRSRLVIRAILEMYSAILDIIERRRYDVFSKRAQVPFLHKLRILGSVLIAPDGR